MFLYCLFVLEYLVSSISPGTPIFWDGEIWVVLSPDDVEEGMIQDGVNGVVGELFLQPRSPIVPAHPQLFDLPLIELDRVVPVTHWNPILRLHKVGEDLGIH